MRTQESYLKTLHGVNVNIIKLFRFCKSPIGKQFVICVYWLTQYDSVRHSVNDAVMDKIQRLQWYIRTVNIFSSSYNKIRWFLLWWHTWDVWTIYLYTYLQNIIKENLFFARNVKLFIWNLKKFIRAVVINIIKLLY